MTSHYFENDLVSLHYYKFGSGKQAMLCFHGYGMHGRQFKILEPALGSRYTFFGFDLFFHEKTELHNQSLELIRKGLTKKVFAGLIEEFCKHEGIGKFSVIGYSMGTHYATVVAEELAARVNEYIIAAPACLKPGALVSFFSNNKLGNKILEKLVLSEKALLTLLKLCKTFKFLDAAGYNILYKEFNTAQLRFNFYACFTYLRYFETNGPKLVQALDAYKIRSIFIFGKYDTMYPPGIGKSLIDQIKQAETFILDENHEMINKNFETRLTRLLE